MTMVDCPFCGGISVPAVTKAVGQIRECTGCEIYFCARCSGAAAWVNGALRCIALLPCTSKR